MQCRRNVSAHNNSQADGAEDVIRRSIPSRTFIVLSPKRARFAVAARISSSNLN
jgi:hypothetical protein